MVQKNKKAVLIGLLLLVSAFVLPATLMVRGQDETLFSFTLTTPSTNPSRQEWSEVIQTNLQDVGIDAQRVIQDWGTIYDRALDPPADIVGKSFADGGFDALFVGYALGTDPDPYAVWHSSQTPPGQNYYNFVNEENDRLTTLIKETVDDTERLGYVAEWQDLMHEESPSLVLMYTEEVVAFDPTALVGESFENLHYPLWPEPHYWDLASGTEQTTIVLAQTGPAPEEGLNPWVTTSYYDLTVFGSVFNRLMRHENLVPPIPMEPELATSWSVADDDKTWTVNLREGVKWHDGTEFTAEDVKFTYTAAMAEELASQTGAFVEAIIGSPDNIEIVNDYQLIFNLPEPYSYFISGLLGAGTTGWMLPKHILEDVPYEEWRSHPFNTGEGSYEAANGYTAYGPLGTGPYWYMAYDPITFTNFMGKNTDYWDAAALEAAGLFEIEEYRVVFIEGSDAAITSLRQGDVDVLDSQYHLETKVDSLEAPWGDWIRYEAFGVQELGINMEHPILGTGVDTPLGQEDPSKAAEAARYVRQAISHLIPRQSIIDTILDGFGTPAITNTICTLTAGYDPSIDAHAYDVELAKSLLAAAGYETGVAPPGGDFLGEYGLYLAVAVVVVVVAIGAVYFIRKR
jgi:ABC-type transport system substrate-binding protein